MFTTLVSAALLSLAIRGARADFEINTPTFTECQPANISWSNTGAAPYNLIVVPANDPCGDEVADLGDFYGTSASWTVALAAGEDVMLSVMDASGDEAWSGSISVLSGDSSCLSSASASASGVGSSAQSAAATHISSSGSSSTGAVANVAPEETGSAAQTVGAANTGDDPTSAGFSIHQLNTPIMILSAVAALALAL